MSGVDVLALLERISDGEGDTEMMALQAIHAVAELLEANQKLTRAVRAFADGDMSDELRRRLFLADSDEPAKEAFGVMCEVCDESEASLARFRGGAA